MGSKAEYRQYLADQERERRETERNIAEAKLARQEREAREDRVERTTSKGDS